MYQEFSYVKELIITEDENRRTTILTKLNDANKETEKLRAQYENTYVTGEEKSSSTNIKKSLQTMKSIVLKCLISLKRINLIKHIHFI